MAVCAYNLLTLEAEIRSDVQVVLCYLVSGQYRLHNIFFSNKKVIRIKATLMTARLDIHMYIKAITFLFLIM